MRGENDRRRPVGQPAQMGDELRANNGVESGRGLVEEKEPRFGEQLDGDAGPLALPAAQGADPDADLTGQAHGVDRVANRVVDLSPRRRRREAEPGGVAERALKGQVGMDDVVLGHKSEHAAEAPRIGVHVDAVEAHRPGRHRGDTGDRLEQRRLACAARTDDCHELTSRDGERHGIKQRDLASTADTHPAGQPADVNADAMGPDAGGGRHRGWSRRVERSVSVLLVKHGHRSSLGTGASVTPTRRRLLVNGGHGVTTRCWVSGAAVSGQDAR